MLPLDRAQLFFSVLFMLLFPEHVVGDCIYLLKQVHVGLGLTLLCWMRALQGN